MSVNKLGNHWEFHLDYHGYTAPFNYESGNEEIRANFYEHVQPFIHDFCKYLVSIINAHKPKNFVCTNKFGSNHLTKALQEKKYCYSGVIKFGELEIVFILGFLVCNTYMLEAHCAIEVED